MPSPEEVAKRLSPAQWQKRLKASYAEMAQVLEDAAKAEAPVRTGSLRDSLRGQVSHGSQPIKVVSQGQEEVLGYVVNGTPPHVIEGNPWLFWEGAEHPVMRVMHPGTEPNDFLERAAENARPDLEAVMQAEAEAWLSTIGQ